MTLRLVMFILSSNQTSAFLHPAATWETRRLSRDPTCLRQESLGLRGIPLRTGSSKERIYQRCYARKAKSVSMMYDLFNQNSRSQVSEVVMFDWFVG